MQTGWGWHWLLPEKRKKDWKSGEIEPELQRFCQEGTAAWLDPHGPSPAGGGCVTQSPWGWWHLLQGPHPQVSGTQSLGGGGGGVTPRKGPTRRHFLTVSELRMRCFGCKKEATGFELLNGRILLWGMLEP